MRRTSLFDFLYFLIISLLLKQIVIADTEKQSKFYCDDSSDALEYVPAERSCISLAGQNRCWFTYTPEQDEQETVPLVLDLHGYISCAAANPPYTGWRERAYEDNFYVVWPQGTNDIAFSFIPCWNAGSCCCPSNRNIPDSRLINKIIKRTIKSSNGRIDPKRIYIAGHSNGCFMSQKFVADYPGVVAAVACHAGVMLEEHPSNEDVNLVPTTIVTVHGDEDTAVSYPTTSSDLGAEDNIDLWGESNGCTKKTIEADSSNEYITHTWSGCDRGVSNQLIQVLGGSHSPYASSGFVDTTSIAWEYIKTMSLDPDCPSGQGYVSIEITTDDDPADTSWKIVKRSGNTVIRGGNYVEGNFKYTTAGGCVPRGCYTFTIYDASGDGLSGNGGYAIYGNGNPIVEGSFDGGFEKSVSIGCGEGKLFGL